VKPGTETLNQFIVAYIERVLLLHDMADHRGVVLDSMICPVAVFVRTRRTTGILALVLLASTLGACRPAEPALPHFVISRAEWKALPAEHAKLLLFPERSRRDTLLVVVHHTALDARLGPRELQWVHMHRRGFADLGYHFVIDTGGSVYEGRRLRYQGAHVAGQNDRSVGVVLAGSFGESAPSSAAMASLGAMLQWLCSTRHPAVVVTHADLNVDTRCPGALLAAELQELVRLRVPACGRR